MDQVIDAGSTDLVALIPSLPTASTFTDEKEAEKLYASIERIVDEFKPDTSTKTGRDAIKSLAHKVAKVKVAIDKQGLTLTEGWRKDIGLVNASRKKIETRLEELQARARKPYDDWEADETARISKHQDNLDSLIALVETPLGKSSDDLKQMLAAVEIMEIGDEWEEFKPKATVVRLEAIGVIGRLMQIAEKSEADARELETLRAEKDRRDKEDEERRQQEEATRAEAQRVENERLAEEQRQTDIANAAAKEAADQIAAAERRAKDAEAKAQQAIDDAKAEAERIAADERKRIADESEAQRLRDEDIEHRRAVNSAIAAKLVACADISGDQARSIVAALVRGTIPNVTLTY